MPSALRPCRRVGAFVLLATLVVTPVVAGETGDTRLPAHIDTAPLPYFDRLRILAVARGIQPAVAAAALATLLPDNTVLARSGTQAEHTRTPGDYVSALVSEERIAKGQARLAELADTLRAIEAAYGVDRHILVAIWGIESGYGERQGEYPVIQALATLAEHDARRRAFWTEELIAALRIVVAGDITPERLLGSWAGAMGHTQFMPSSYLAHAVDFDRDGRRDIWNSPADGLASAANYLRAAGWITGAAWGCEVRLPGGVTAAGGQASPLAPAFDLAEASPLRATSRQQWQALGLQPAASAATPAGPWLDLPGRLQLLLPQGVRGPAFLVGTNFDVLLRYNNATLYALAVGHLADRLRGTPILAQPWPPEPALTREQRLELQRRLAQHGHDPGDFDGILGLRTRDAVRAFQRANGLAADGYPGAGLLERLTAGDVL